MMKNILLLLISFSITLSASSQTNINLSNYAFADTEPFIAVNPVNQNNLIAAWMRVTGLTQVTIAYTSSNNGGNTWSTPQLMPHLYSSFTNADVSIAFNSSGTAHICYIDYAPTLDSGYVMIASSSNGGTSWNTPVQVISGFEKPDNPIDRPWIAIDKSASIYSGRIYIVSKSVDDVTTLPHHVWMKYSANNGITWSTLTMLDDSTVNNLISNSMAVVTTGADGSIYAAYANWASVVSYPQFILKKSIDGGQTFSSSVIVTAVAGSGITDSLYQGSYSISANPTNYNNIVFISTDSRNGDPDILSVNSIDGGTTWTSNPIRLNDDSIGNGAGQEMCWGSFSVNGNYTCAWRDRRNSGSGSSAPFELFCSVSQDGGNTFSANAKLSTASSPVIPIVKGNDFLGVAIDSANVYSVWCDKRTGNTEIFFSKKAINTITTTTAIKNNFDFVKVTPNLSQGDFSIELNKNISSEISITSVDGRMIQQITLEANSIKTLSHIYIKNKGIYFLKVKAKSIEQIIKLVVT